MPSVSQMREVADSWLADQQQCDRDLFLIVDRLAAPDPVVDLFSRGLMRDYVNLYQQAGWTELESVGPWIICVPDGLTSELDQLLCTPERNWGWLASAEQLDLVTLANHWHERLLIEQNGTVALYRFQDNRVIGHHLQQLTEQHLPLLMGPLQSALCWQQKGWLVTDNPNPDRYPHPVAKPWLDIPESAEVQRNILLHNFKQWLWTQHPVATSQRATLEPLEQWLDKQLDTAVAWDWLSLEQQRFLIRQRLDPSTANHPIWTALGGETADAHYQRCYQRLQGKDYL